MEEREERKREDDDKDFGPGNVRICTTCCVSNEKRCLRTSYRTWLDVSRANEGKAAVKDALVGITMTERLEAPGCLNGREWGMCVVCQVVDRGASYTVRDCASK